METGLSKNTQPHVVSVLQRFSDTRDRVLEIGCGGGQYRSVVSGSYVGIDLPAVKYPGQGPDAFADGQVLPFATGSFSLVFFVAVLHLIPDVERALTEVHRVLAPGGRVLVFDYNYWATRRLAHLNLKKYNKRNRVWSPWGLAACLRRAGFRPHVEWNYVRGVGAAVVALQRLTLVRFVRFWLWQFTGDWSIVQGARS